LRHVRSAPLLHIEAHPESAHVHIRAFLESRERACPRNIAADVLKHLEGVARRYEAGKAQRSRWFIEQTLQSPLQLTDVVRRVAVAAIIEIDAPLLTFKLLI
jgi:hypothetical protein